MLQLARLVYKMSHTDLPADRFDEALQFVKAQYRALTGSDLETGTQEQLL